MNARIDSIITTPTGDAGLPVQAIETVTPEAVLSLLGPPPRYLPHQTPEKLTVIRHEEWEAPCR